MQVAGPGSPLQAAEAAEVDTGLGSGVDIGEGTGCGTVVEKGNTCREVEVEEREDKMEEGDMRN